MIKHAAVIVMFGALAVLSTAGCGAASGPTNPSGTTSATPQVAGAGFVTVGFWQDPTCSGTPTGTTAFPVNFGDTKCFTWTGRSGENSASRFSCGDQTFYYTQWTTLTCSGGQVPEGTAKTVNITGCTQGVPVAQYARILDFSGCAK